VKALQISQAKKDADNARQSREKYSKMQDCPDPAVDENFGEWMKFQKNNWRKIRQNMKENKSVVPSTEKKSTAGLGHFMRNMDEVVLNSNWHIISIQP